jgi:LAS seventeen-binding protein 5
MPLASSILLLYAPSCLDVGVTELPTDVGEVRQSPEHDSLLPREEIEEACGHCTHCNKRKRAAFEAYPQTAAPSKRLRLAQPPTQSRRILVARLIFTLSSLCKDRRRYKLLTRYRCHKQKKPYSSISVHIERLTSENYDEDDLAGIPDLIEVIRLQGSGPTEAARAIRKKLKYANVHRQLRALTILDGLLQNGGPRFQRAIFCDEPLLERLRIAATDPLSDPDVREKCKVLFGQWAASSKTQPELAGAAALYRQLPKKTKALDERREQSKVLRENEEESRREDPFAAEEDEEPSSPEDTTRRPSVLTKASGPASPRTSISHTSQPVHLSAGPTFGFGKSSKKEKKKKTKGFNLEREKPAMLQSIAASSVASTNLSNALKLVNREQKRVSEDPEVMSRFETCKQLRRHILRYIQYVETDDFLGGLIHANEELVTALMAFEVMDKSVDDDSDSELEEAQHLSRTAQASDKAAQSMAGLSLADKKPEKPPRPGKVTIPPPRPPPAKTNWKAKQIESDSESEEEDDDPNDPFGDKNAATTPRGERKGYTWREV